MFIQRPLVMNIVLAVNKQLEEMSMAMLWLMAYTFLLRVPSEALPMTRGGFGIVPANEQAVFYLESESTVCIKLASRKNQQRGAVIRRSCTCRKQNDLVVQSDLLCPVHTLWNEFFAELPLASKPWADISPGTARTTGSSFEKGPLVVVHNLR